MNRREFARRSALVLAAAGAGITLPRRITAEPRSFHQHQVLLQACEPGTLYASVWQDTTAKSSERFERQPPA